MLAWGLTLLRRRRRWRRMLVLGLAWMVALVMVMVLVTVQPAPAAVRGALLVLLGAQAAAAAARPGCGRLAWWLCPARSAMCGEAGGAGRLGEACRPTCHRCVLLPHTPGYRMAHHHATPHAIHSAGLLAQLIIS